MVTKESTKAAINNFMIYEIVIREAQQQLAYPTISPEDAVNNATDIFASLFKGANLNLYQYRKTQNGLEPEKFPNDIMSVHEGVYLLRINNNKKTKMVEQAETTTNGIPDYEENTYISNPYCYVVVDNRAEKGICQMAIQKNSAWGDTHKVRNLLQQNLNRKFIEEGIPLSLSITAKMRPSKIWEFCQQRCREGQDTIKRISFDFPNQRKIATSNRIPRPTGYVKQLARLMDLTDAIKTHIHLDYIQADPDDIEKNAKDLANIVHICTNKEYNLSILFKNYGAYRCDEMVRAMFPMKEELLNAFITKWESIPFDEENFGLYTWCNEVYEQSKLFDNVDQTPNKRNRENS